MTGTDVDKIVQDVRAEILDKGYREASVDFLSCVQRESAGLDIWDSYLPEKCDDLLFRQSKMWKNKIGQPRKTGQKVIDFVMKYTKKMIGFIMNPWIDSQNEFNANVVSTEYQIYEYMKWMEKRIEKLEKQIQILENE